MYRGQTHFRPPNWQFIMAAVVDVGASVAAFFYWKTVGIDWVFGTLAFIAVVSGAGIVELLMTSIDLTETEMRVRQRGRLHTYARKTISQISWEAGTPAAIQLHDGNWVKLPEVGRNNRALSNSIRAWLRAT